MVGCSYRGLPDTVAPQRNLIGAAMSFRRSLFDEVGHFDTAMGRVGTLPLGCEETEFALRVREAFAGTKLVHVPLARVHHHVGGRADEDQVLPEALLRGGYLQGSRRAACRQRAGARQRTHVCALDAAQRSP